MPYIIPYLTIKNLIIILIILIIIITIINNNNYIKTCNIKDDKFLIRFIDKYYIINIYFVVFFVILYICIHIGLLFILRFFYLGTYRDIHSLDIEILSSKIVFLLLFMLVLFIIVMLLVYYVLDLLFFPSILKLYIYLINNNSIANIVIKIKNTTIKDFIGPLYLFVDNIAKFNIELTHEDYDEHYLYEEIYQNKFLIKIHKNLIKTCSKFVFIHLLFKLLQKGFRILYLHLTLNSLNIIIPSLTIFCCLFYDIMYFQQFHYIYIIFFILSIYRLFYKSYKFLDKKLCMYDLNLHNYFYKNSVSYNTQRPWILLNEKINNIIYQSPENKTFIKELSEDEDFRDYLLHNLMINNSNINITSYINSIYQRFTVMIIQVILSIYFFQHYNDYNIFYNVIKLPQEILLIPLCLMYYFHKNSYKKSKNEVLEGLAYYTYNKKSALIYWLLALIQFYIFFIIIFKIKFMLIPDETLFNFYDFKIFFMYSLEYKKEFFDNYFDFYARYRGFSDLVLDNLYIVKKETNYEDFIIEKLTLKEIKTLAECFIDNYIMFIQVYNEIFLQDYSKYLDNNKNIRAIMDCFSNLINIIVFWEFFIAYIEAYFSIENPINPKFAKLLVTFFKVFNKF